MAGHCSQSVGLNEFEDDIRPVSFMDYDLVCIDLDARPLQHMENPFRPRVSLLS